MNKILFLLTLPFLFFLSSCDKKVETTESPIEVLVTEVLKQNVLLESEFTGETYGQSDIQINPRVEGVILSMNFTEGSKVIKGQLLYTIDPLPYQAEVNRAAAGLAETQSNLAKAKSDLEMIEPLAKINAVSQRELVHVKATYEASIASHEAAKATLENAQIRLGYCSVIAPISGLIGMSKVRVGDYVQPGALAVLTTISDLVDMRVRFTVSEQEYLRIFRELNKENSAIKGVGKSISIKLSDGSLYPQKGKVSFADRQIDHSTGALTFEASFPNPDELLRPGQYVKVIVVTDVRNDALLVPQRAVIEMQGIYQVYVLGDSSKVQLQIIKPGPIFRDAYVVEEGLEAGNKIAFGGTQLLRNGTVIAPKMVDWDPSSNKQ